MNPSGLSSSRQGVQDRIIVALDVPDLRSAEYLLQELEGVISYYKIGLELFTAVGWRAVELVKNFGGHVFLDLKLHDIPTTVGRTVRVISEHGVDMFSLHGLGGLEMLRQATRAVRGDAREKKEYPIPLAVTLLTSHSEEDLREQLGIDRGIREEVLSLATLAREAGLKGVICSPREVRFLREHFQDDFLLVTPGIRPRGSTPNDQKRTYTPAEAFQAGADYIVIGRPITHSPHPRQVAHTIVDEIT